jgi:hypothetical protein
MEFGGSASRCEIRFVDEFPHSYVVDVAPDWRDEKVLSFPAHEKLGIQTGQFQDIRFYPREGESWTGRFEWSQRGKFEHGIFSTPNPDHAFVISRGAGFWVDVNSREVTNLELLPITSALASRSRSSILITTWQDLYAYSSPMPSWSLRNVALDRLQITQIDGDLLTAIGFIQGADFEIKIDIAKGTLVSRLQIG